MHTVSLKDHVAKMIYNPGLRHNCQQGPNRGPRMSSECPTESRCHLSSAGRTSSSSAKREPQTQTSTQSDTLQSKGGQVEYEELALMKTYLIMLFNNLSIENSDSYFKCAISGHRKESQKTKWYMVDIVTLDLFVRL